MDEQQMIERLLSAPPSCLTGFAATLVSEAAEAHDTPSSTWHLTCRCGERSGRLLGYSLKDYNRDYDGPECFLGPLAFECSQCRVVTELLDTDRHGYHAETARLEGGIGSVKLRGQGPRQSFPCPKCQTDIITLEVGFVFWNPEDLAELFETDWENVFNEFLCRCQCRGCGETSEPTDFGKL